MLSISELGRLLDEEMSATERVDLEDAEACCRRFLEWDPQIAMSNNEDAKDELCKVLERERGGSGV